MGELVVPLIMKDNQWKLSDIDYVNARWTSFFLCLPRQAILPTPWPQFQHPLKNTRRQCIKKNFYRLWRAGIKGATPLPWGVQWWLEKRWLVGGHCFMFLQRAQCSHCKRCTRYSNSVCPSVCLSVCLSVRPSVRPSRRYCVKTTACSTVQFAPLDSKMCLVL